LLAAQSPAHRTLGDSQSHDGKVLDAAAMMGKSQTIGHRGIYLKGKGVVRGQDFILNLILNRIEDPLKIC
jgi:hypothetical protein